MRDISADGTVPKVIYKRTSPLPVISSCLALVAFLASCNSSNTAGVSPSEQPVTEPRAEEPTGAFVIQSTAFKNGDVIPLRYSCDGDDISPPLNWTGVPEDTRSFTLIMEDPDAPGGTWVHWVVFNIPSDTRMVDPGDGTQSDLLEGTRVGNNGWGEAAYGGPCPPTGTHRYIFTLYALDTHLDLSQGASSDVLREAILSHILSSAELMGTFSR
jgi:Raf kinase inhibitor-like YbhB/YbcL family protein